MKTDNLIAFSVPMFALAGMASIDGQPSAKVLEHDGKLIKLDVSGTQLVVACESKDRYVEGTILLFNDEGAAVGYEDNGKDILVKKQKRETAESNTGGRRSGSMEYRKDDLRQ